jgi:hypothetical protein
VVKITDPDEGSPSTIEAVSAPVGVVPVAGVFEPLFEV